ncbi:hypothetical protein F2P56_025342, partial [Juglans regia]
MAANIHQLPWMVMGDFNIIRNDSERRGGQPRLALAMEEFNDWVGACGLLDMPFCGNSFSWCNGHSGRSRQWARLDRCFLNTAALDIFPDAKLEYLSRTSSDHAPMSIFLENQFVSYGYPSFKFQQMWWNKHVFGRTEFHIAELEARIRGLEASLQSEYIKDVEDDLVVSQLELSV